MQEKFTALLLYGLIGLLLALLPLWVKRPHSTGQVAAARAPSMFNGYGMPILCIALVVLLLAFTRTLIPGAFLYLLLGVSVGVGFWHRASITNALWAGAGTLLACTVGATLVWWRREQPGLDISSTEIIFFAVVLLAAGTILLSRGPVLPAKRLENLFYIGIYVAITAYFSFSLASLAEPGAWLTLWHHWGAYIGPSELVLSGARLFYDFPAQYGAGPTFLLALACAANGWIAVHWVVSTIIFVYGLLIGAMALLVAPGGRYRTMLLLLLCTVACGFWIAYPPAVSGPGVTPSTSGMRFLPAVALTTWILFTGRKSFVFRSIGGHVFWVIGLLWSPESTFYVTAIWWPVYMFDCIHLKPEAPRLATLLRALVRLATLAIGAIAVIVFIYYLAYHVLPVPRYFLAYLLYPPGAMPINPYGSIWFFVFAMVLSAGVSWSVWRSSGDTVRFRRSLALELLAFSAFVYYLGRSHDNNILNFSPMMMLLLVDALASTSGVFARKAAAFGLASLLAWLPVFGWQSWREGYQDNYLTEFNFSAILAKFDYAKPATVDALATRIGVAPQQIIQTRLLMEEISRRGEPFMVLDQFYLLQPNYPTKVWSAIHGPVDFVFLPSPMRREFLSRTAKFLQRDGWLVVSRGVDSAGFLADFDSVYDRTDRIDFDTAYAIRFTPKASFRSSEH